MSGHFPFDQKFCFEFLEISSEFLNISWNPNVRIFLTNNFCSIWISSQNLGNFWFNDSLFRNSTISGFSRNFPRKCPFHLSPFWNLQNIWVNEKAPLTFFSEQNLSVSKTILWESHIIWMLQTPKDLNELTIDQSNFKLRAWGSRESCTHGWLIGICQESCSAILVFLVNQSQLKANPSTLHKVKRVRATHDWFWFSSDQMTLVASVSARNFSWGPKWPLKTFFRGHFFRKGANKLKATEGKMRQGTKENKTVY